MMWWPWSRRFAGLARIGAVAVIAALMAGVVSPASADNYPERPVQLVVPAGPGSSTDTIMRSLAQVAAPMLGQPIVILNKPGASGTIGVGFVTKSEPDGYTIGGVPSGAITMAPHVAAQSFQQADYRIVAMITQAAGVLCVHPDFPAKNAGEFLAELKNNPDKYTYGSDGVGAFVQFSTARIFQPEGIRQRIIPFTGADQTVTAFLARTIDIYGGAIASIAQFVAEGKAKCLLLTTARRFPTLPDVEGLDDVKMAPSQTLLWRAVIAPRDIPQDRFEKLRDVLTRAAQSPEFKAMAAKRGEEVWVISAEDAAKYAQSEFVQMEQLARELRLKPN
ncbi:tripartite tricarboxylate transporter substrate binding protein [Bradyrhizobium sp. AUGA SZCCT0222]|uniref:Bug family tripartite tricarboxylate transporter substrate binding protein n=1 Tax=Bradyrhizobium sp. AUGA SZCCT0222 TaxID=2807668 RepID=UPI001BAC9F87|nr:tripartite tricarboxylate transporter substrate binding protein [Bradyrhizobium sp. AUGA SZCCT0222]MBR1271691.1 tripartite tricarboxylate transporter substrate binding protein [Bradyrhizobium sp. AUGA SZCCT0222]